MAKLPSAADLISGRPSIVAQGAPSAARVPEAPKISTGDAEGLAKIGAALEEAGTKIFHVQQVEQERIDKVRAEDAFNQIRSKTLDLTLGDQGFAKKRGGDAVNGKTPLLDEYTQKFDEQSDLVMQGLGNERQKLLYRQRSAVAKQEFQGNILRHVAHESDVYAESVFRGTVDLETRNAMTNWEDPNAIGLSLERIANATKQEGDRKGWKPDDPQRAALAMHSVSMLHASVIGQALANDNPLYAQQYYEANKGQLDPQIAKSVAHSVTEGVQKQLATGYQSAFVDSRNDRRALTGLEKQVAADPNLDEDRKNILLGRITSRGDRLDAQADREAEKRGRMLARQIDGVNKLTLAGYEPTADQMLALVGQVKGTEFEPEVRQMVATANATKSFRLSTPQQQEAAITKLETEARKDPTKFDVTVIDRFKRIYAGQQNEIKQDPITFATRQGIIREDDPAAQPLDLADPSKLGPQLQARFDLSRALAGRYQAPVKPLTKEEADALSGALKTAPVSQKSAYFAQLATASGGDFDGYRSMIAQIAPDDPVTAHAGIMAGRGKLATNAGFTPDQGKANNVADLILRGQAVLHPDRKTDGSPEKGKLWPMPKDEELAKGWQSYERDAFAGKPEARNGFLQTAKAIYAARTVEAGDGSGVLDGSRWDEAMKLATGGVERWNGKSIVMPWGYSKGQFKDELARRVDDIETSGRLAKGVTGDRLRDMPLESIGDGRYVFRAGDGIMVDKGGKPLVVDFTASLPFRSSGYGKEREAVAATGKRPNPKPADLVKAGAMGGGQ